MTRDPKDIRRDRIGRFASNPKHGGTDDLQRFIARDGGMDEYGWSRGTVTDPSTGISYEFAAKAFDLPSVWGIDHGRVSKLSMRDPQTGAWDKLNYDRGWDIRPEDETTLNALSSILDLYPSEDTEETPMSPTEWEMCASGLRPDLRRDV